MFSLSRRTFLSSAAASALMPFPAWAKRPVFPLNFLWGTSTSALQVEGALTEDGRGSSIWDTFAARPGTIADGSTPAIACDHYHRYREDIDLMKQAGLNAYRFSISWPRVVPQGTGLVNPAGLDFYDRLVDSLLESGISPMACLYHWDLPQALQDRGGWLNREIADWFTDYAVLMVRRLGDRVADWFALNEPSVTAIFGYALTGHAPGLGAGKQGALTALHHQNLAQGRALRALRAERSKLRLGTVLSLQPAHPFTHRSEDRAAARRWDALWNRVSLDGLTFGRPPAVFAEDLHRLAKPGDWREMRFPIDQLGMNYYSPMTMQFQPGQLCDVGYAPVNFPRKTAMGWPVEPQGLFQQLVDLKRHYGNPRVVITETGAAYDDPPRSEGHIADVERISFLRDHLRQVARARAAGCRVEGFLVWSLLDNWEWASGYGPKFGLVRVDMTNQERLPKDSFHWLAESAAQRKAL